MVSRAYRMTWTLRIVLEKAREIREREQSYMKIARQPGMTWAKLKQIQLEMRGER